MQHKFLLLLCWVSCMSLCTSIAGSSTHNRVGLVSPASLADGLVWMVWAKHCTQCWWTLNLHKALCKLAFCKILLTTHSQMYGIGELPQGHHREQPATGHFTLLNIWGCVQHIRPCLCCKAIVVKVTMVAFCCKTPGSLCNGSTEFQQPLNGVSHCRMVLIKTWCSKAVLGIALTALFLFSWWLWIQTQPVLRFP